MIILGVDTGGTFTDFVLASDKQLTIHKVLSTPKAPEQAILQGIRELGLDSSDQEALFIIHGSTVATNAVLEGKGVRTAYITNRGLADILTIGRQARRELYNLQPIAKPPPVPRELCLETGGRLDSTGQVIEALNDEDISQIRQKLGELKPQAVAINLLFSFIDDKFEKRITEAIHGDIFISRSSEVLPEYKEYERGIATWLNAAVGPIVQGYLMRLCDGVEKLTSNHIDKPHISIMQSSGGTIDAAQAGKQAVQLLLSGPAGGLAGAKYVAQCAGAQRLLSFDMGGTSTDVALIDGEIVLTTEGRIGDYPVAIPMVDMHTIGAGGGSIARVDEGGLLQVGPRSAGADPGPACYGKGGKAATVTDANLILGRLRPDLFLGGKMSLDTNASHKAVERLADDMGMDVIATAQGIIKIVNEHMARALRVMSVQKGIDPQLLTLVSFGGAGGLHVCALADALNMKNAIVPIHAGVLSALGMLAAPRSRLLSKTVNLVLNEVNPAELESIFADLEKAGIEALKQEGVAAANISTARSVDLRYRGQSYTLNVSWDNPQRSAEVFTALHEKRYGHHLQQPVELVTVRVKLSGKKPDIQLSATDPSKSNKDLTALQQVSLPGISEDVNVYHRASLPVAKVIQGPALITETVSTTYLAPRWCCSVDQYGNLVLKKRN